MPKVSKYGAISSPYCPVFSTNTEKWGPLFTQYFFLYIFISFLAGCIKFNEVLRRHCLIISSTVLLICFHLTSVGNGGCNYYVTINFCGGFSLKVKEIFWIKVSRVTKIDQRHSVCINILYLLKASIQLPTWWNFSTDHWAVSVIWSLCLQLLFTVTIMLIK